MKIITCVKAVPDRGSRLVINEQKTWIKDSELSLVPNEADTYALEEALRIREGLGGEVVAVSVGDESSLRSVRSALATGADRAILLSDPLFRHSDELATARILARAVKKDGGADLLCAGVQSDDLGTGATGIMLAELLGWPHASVVIGVQVDAESRKVRVDRELEGGVIEHLELQMPCVLTLQYGVNRPRYATLKGIMAAKKKTIVRWDRTDLDLEENHVGVAGALYEVAEVFVPRRDGSVQMLAGSPQEVALSLVEKLRNEAKVL